MPIEKKKIRIDFKTVWQVVDEEKGLFKALMVPDPDRYELRTINGKRGYYDKYDNVFISEEVLAEGAKTLSGKPIFAPAPSVRNTEQYFTEARKRIAESLESEAELKPQLDRGSAYLQLNVGRKLLFVVLYIDIVGSTRLSRVLSDVAQRTLISTFVREMTLMADAHEGLVHKYTGDGLIAFFPQRIISWA
jgi:hypothetical protein